MKKIVFIIVCIILLLFVIPIGINEAYKIDGYVTDWDTKDAFLFYGSVLGGVATLLGIYITILHENHMERYQEISKWLFDALDNLDASMSLSFKKRIDEKMEHLLYRVSKNKEKVDDIISTQEFSDLISNARMCKKVEMRFSSNEKKVFKKTLSLLRKYEEEYVDLLQRLRENRKQPVDSIFVESALDKIEKLYREEYINIVDSVQKSLKEFKRCLW